MELPEHKLAEATGAAIANNVSKMWVSVLGDDAGKCLFVLLRLSRVPCAAQADERALLCFLQLWLSPVPADAEG